MRSKRMKGSEVSTELFEHKVLLVHSSDPNVVRAIERAYVVSIGDQSFVCGALISPTPGHFDDGKMVRINLRFVVTITEFESVDQFMRRKKGDLTLVTRRP